MLCETMALAAPNETILDRDRDDSDRLARPGTDASEWTRLLRGSRMLAIRLDMQRVKRPVLATEVWYDMTQARL
jgi:hypothetical protein